MQKVAGVIHARDSPVGLRLVALELVRDLDGSSDTAPHTTNLANLICVAADSAQFRVGDGILADVAPGRQDGS